MPKEYRARVNPTIWELETQLLVIRKLHKDFQEAGMLTNARFVSIVFY